MPYSKQQKIIWVKRRQQIRRAAGLCRTCGVASGLNARTQQPYMFCEEHRLQAAARQGRRYRLSGGADLLNSE